MTIDARLAATSAAPSCGMPTTPRGRIAGQPEQARLDHGTAQRRADG